MKNTVYSMFAQAVAAYGERVAIMENDRKMSFNEFSDLVDIVAESFPQGIKSVGIVMTRRIEMIASIFAVLKCGAMYIPAEPNFPAGRIAFMMSEANVDFILTDKAFEGKVKGFPVVLADCSVCGIKKPSGNSIDRSSAVDPAYVLYTSGTTGRPKGVCVTNRNVCHYVRAFANEFRPRPDDIMLQYSVCSFDIFVEEVFASILNGVALAIPSDDDREDVHCLMGFIQRHGVTMLSGFPYLLAEMNRLAEIPRSLRLLISGGDILRGAYVNNLLDKASVYNTYGPSETTVCASYFRCTADNVLPDGTYPIGMAVEGAKIVVADANGVEVPQGETGEICIYGNGVSLGYIGGRDEENKAFVKSNDGNVMYRSGDLAYVLPDGNIAFLRRKDSQIMIYGKRVEISEVESQLYKCTGVEQAVVRAFADEDGLAYMTAYIVSSDARIKVSEIKRELADNLASFMIPEFIVKMPTIPLNDNGKPDTAKLPVVMKAGALCRK